MSDPAAFVLARVAEEEAAATRCAEAYPSPWDVSDRGHTAFVRADGPNYWTVVELEQAPSLDGWLGDYVEHIARHDPARVLAQCEAFRRIVEFTSRLIHDGEDSEPWAGEMVLRALASIWSDHPDYRTDWDV